MGGLARFWSIWRGLYICDLYINWYYYGGDNDRAARWMGVRLMIGCLVWGRNYGSTHGFWGSKMAKMGVISTGWNCLG